MVCDAGGSTVDISCYEVKSMTSKRMNLQELALPACVAAGGSRVDEALSLYLEQAFSDIYPNDLDIVDGLLYDGMKDFQEHAKRRYTMRNDSISIDVGGRTFNNEDWDIARGTMTINSSVMDSTFTCGQATLKE